MHAYTRRTQVNNRCVEGGKSRGVLSDFRMSRVSDWMIEEANANPLTDDIVLLSIECA